MIGYIIAVIALFVTYIILKVFVFPRYKYAKTDEIPGPPKHWLKGTMHHTKRGPQNLIDSMKFSQQYGGMIRHWRGPFFPVVAIYHADQAKPILKKSHPKGLAYKFLEDWLGEGLLTSFGKEWKRKRRLLTPAFHFKILQRYIPIFFEETELLLEKWEQDAINKKTVDITQDITLCTLDIIGRCAFGCEIGAQKSFNDKERNPFVKSIYDATDLLYSRAFKPWLYSDFVYSKTQEGKKYRHAIDTINNFADSVIAARREALTNDANVIEEVSQNDKLDFLDLLLTTVDEQGNPLSEKEIRDECNTFMFEGHDTTSAGLTWAFYLIAKHPDVEEKILNELREVIGNDVPTYEQLDNLNYTHWVIKEALRLYPSVPTIARKMVEDTEIEMNGNTYVVQKGVDIYIWPYIMHRQPDCYDKPEEFIPERHDPSNNIDPKKNAYSYVPFSAGPRNCIGQKFAVFEEKMIIALVLRKFRLKLDPNHVVECDPALISRAANGIKITFELRDDY